MNNRAAPFFALLTLSLIAAFAAPAFAAENSDNPFILLLDAESLFGYSKIAGDEDGDFSTSNRWLTSLGYKTDASTLLIGAYNGSYDRSQIFIRQEEGDRQSNKLMTNNASFAVKKDIGDFTVRPLIFYNVIWVEETSDEDLSDGLYDYEDFGGGFENTHRFGTGQEQKRLTYGFTAFDRSYPNFTSLISQFDPNGALEEDEKDFMGYKAEAGWEAPLGGGVQSSIGYTFLYKDYPDKLTINENGIRESDHREDFFHEVKAAVFKLFARWIGVGVTSSFDWNDSNLDLYDTRGTASLADDRFFEDYYDYMLFDVSPALHLYHDIDTERKLRAQLTLAYTYEELWYPDREALDSLGALLGDDQEDTAHIVSARLTVPITENLSWISVGQYKEQDSNQKFEQFYSYNYELWSATSGISYQY